MQVTDAFVSGSLGQAIYRENGALCILDAPMADPREALPNETQWFRYAAREVVPAHPRGLSVSIERVRERLDEEIRYFGGLDGLLVGMDRDFSAATRQRAISRAEDVLSADDAVAQRIRERFLIPANTQEWDPVGGLALAVEGGAKAAGDYYRPLAEGIIDRLADDIFAVVRERFGSGIDAAHKREAILRSGLVAELALIEARADRTALSTLVIRRDDFPKLRAADASGQILIAVIRRVETRIAPTSAGTTVESATPITDEAQESESFDPGDPIMAAAERVLAHFEQRRRRPIAGDSADLPSIQREISWIGQKLRAGEIVRAEQALIQLIDRQGQRSRADDLVKTLTAVADLARVAGLFDWTLRTLAAIDLIGSPDAPAMCVRAETLRDLGRYEDALAAFEQTMQRFPHAEVAPNARAETLR
ncbi:MAG: hypothetical protein IID54_05920, partial [Proteobacteria bacterium]|nr:hypothetical protein [Pseudomonadota bacterium]